MKHIPSLAPGEFGKDESLRKAGVQESDAIAIDKFESWWHE